MPLYSKLVGLYPLICISDLKDELHVIMNRNGIGYYKTYNKQNSKGVGEVIDEVPAIISYLMSKDAEKLSTIRDVSLSSDKSDGCPTSFPIHQSTKEILQIGTMMLEVLMVPEIYDGGED